MQRAQGLGRDAGGVQGRYINGAELWRALNIHFDYIILYFFSKMEIYSLFFLPMISNLDAV